MRSIDLLIMKWSSCWDIGAWASHHNGFVPLIVAQNGLAKKIEKSRKQKKERRNRTKKIRGVKKTASEFGAWTVYAIIIFFYCISCF